MKINSYCIPDPLLLEQADALGDLLLILVGEERGKDTAQRSLFRSRYGGCGFV